MAVVTDLSWVELNNAFGPSFLNRQLITVETDAYGSKVMLDIGVLLGREITSASRLGVIEGILKLREVCVMAQIAANQGKATGEKLNSFGPATYGTITNNAAPINAPITAKISIVPLGQNQIVGVNV